MRITVDRDVEIDELLALYTSVGWSAYTDDPTRLATAVANSTIVVTARDEHEHLVGLVRGLSDDATIFYLQDLLVRPERQGQGVGRRLLEACVERYGHVRQRVLLADDDVAVQAFYERQGFRRVADLDPPLQAYLGVES